MRILIVKMDMLSRIFCIACFIALTTQACSGTNVSVTVNNDTFMVGDTVELLLEVYPTDPAGVGGQFTLYERVNNSYHFVRRFLAKPSPYQCPSCTGIPGTTPIRQPYKGMFYFIPTREGFYNADANFEGVKDAKNFTVFATTTTTTTTTTTRPKPNVLCSQGALEVLETSMDAADGTPKLGNINPEHKVGETYYTSDITDDEIETKPGRNKFSVIFYVPEDLGSEAWIYVKAGTEDGLPGETNFSINSIYIGGCSISGLSTGGVMARWGECNARLDANLLLPGAENKFTVENNVVPGMFGLGTVDYDYMQLNCTPREATTTTTTLPDCETGRRYNHTAVEKINCSCPAGYEFKTLEMFFGPCPRPEMTDCPASILECVNQTGVIATTLPTTTIITTTTKAGVENQESTINSNIVYIIVGLACVIGLFMIMKRLK